MTDSLEDLYKRLLAAQQELYLKTLECRDNIQEKIKHEVETLEKDIIEQINTQLNKEVIIINIDLKFSWKAARITLRRIIEKFGSTMTIVNLTPCPIGYQYKRLKIGDTPGNIIAIEYLGTHFTNNDKGIIDGKVLFEDLRNPNNLSKN